MHEDQVNEELEKFMEASKNKGVLKVPLEFESSDNPIEFTGSDIDFGEPRYIKKDKERAIDVNPNKKQQKGFFELDERRRK